MLFDKELTSLLLVPEGMEGVAVLPDSLATVPACVLSRCIKLTAVQGGIGNDTFAFQDSIIYTKDKTQLIAAPAGLGTTALIADECTSIASGAFAGNIWLKTIVSSGAVESISETSFEQSVVENATVAINASETDFDKACEAWKSVGFTNFANPAHPGQTIEPINGSGFAFTLLDDYTLAVRWQGEEAAPENLQIPLYGMIDGIRYKVSTIADEGFKGQPDIQRVELPDSLISIGTSAFEGAKELNTINIPGSVTIIADRAFANCESLVALEMNEGLTTIGDSAFEGIAQISQILPKSVKSVGDYAFANSPNLETVVALGNISAVGANALAGNTGVSLYVPYNEEEAYAWNIGTPAAGNHLYPYGVKLPSEAIQVEVGQQANLFDNGYLEAPGAIEVNYSYKAKPISVSDDGVVEAKEEGSSNVGIELSLQVRQVIAPTVINKNTTLSKAVYDAGVSDSVKQTSDSVFVETLKNINLFGTTSTVSTYGLSSSSANANLQSSIIDFESGYSYSSGVTAKFFNTSVNTDDYYGSTNIAVLITSSGPHHYVTLNSDLSVSCVKVNADGSLSTTKVKFDNSTSTVGTCVGWRINSSGEQMVIGRNYYVTGSTYFALTTILLKDSSPSSIIDFESGYSYSSGVTAKFFNTSVNTDDYYGSTNIAVLITSSGPHHYVTLNSDLSVSCVKVNADGSLSTTKVKFDNSTSTVGTCVGWKINGKEVGVGETVYATGSKYLAVSVIYGVSSVTLNNQSATTGGTASIAVHYKQNMPSITCPTRTGYIFGGYYTGTSGSGTQYYTNSGASARVWDLENNTTLYAKWTPITYTVTFNKNHTDTGGTGTMSSMTNVAYNTTSKLTANAFKRPGWTFSGWATSASGAKVYNDQAAAKELSTTNGATVNLYAVWTANTYYVKYDANGGTGAPAAETTALKRGGTTSLVVAAGNNTKKTGYHLLGWALDSTATSATYIGTDDDKRKLEITDTVVAKGVQRTGTNTYDITLYAVWAPNTYVISFDNNGGEGTVPSAIDTNLKTAATVNLPSYTPTKTGYNKLGWATSSTATTAAYTTSFTLTTTLLESITPTTIDASNYKYGIPLYAVWAANTNTQYKVNHWLQNIYDDEYTLIDSGAEIGAGTSDAKLTVANLKKGSTLSGFTCEEPDNQEFTIAADGSLVVDLHYKRNIHTVIYEYDTSSYVPEDASELPAQESYRYGADVVVFVPTGTGYHMTWANNAGVDNSGHFAMPDTNVTFKAPWTPNDYFVTFHEDANGLPVGVQQLTYDKSDTLTKTVSRGEGWEFLGWSTEPGSGGTSFDKDVAYIHNLTSENGGFVALYARWKGGSFTIAYDGNGATEGQAGEDWPTAGDLGVRVALPQNDITENFKRPGYSFVGWSTKPGATVVEFAGGQDALLDSAVVSEGDVKHLTLYAVWAAQINVTASVSPVIQLKVKDGVVTDSPAVNATNIFSSQTPQPVLVSSIKCEPVEGTSGTAKVFPASDSWRFVKVQLSDSANNFDEFTIDKSASAHTYAANDRYKFVIPSAGVEPGRLPLDIKLEVPERVSAQVIDGEADVAKLLFTFELA